MKNINWLQFIGGLIALIMAAAMAGGTALLIGAPALYGVAGIGLALMIWDFIVSTRETAEKRQQS